MHSGRLRSAQEAGKQIVSLVKQGINARDILTREALENAIREAKHRPSH